MAIKRSIHEISDDSPSRYDIMAECSQASTSDCFSGLGLDESCTQSAALADAEELERLRKQTPSPVQTELCYSGWEAQEVSMYFKTSGDIKIRDFLYTQDDPRHRGAPPPPISNEQEKEYERINKERSDVYEKAKAEREAAEAAAKLEAALPLVPEVLPAPRTPPRNRVAKPIPLRRRGALGRASTMREI
ncbi:hypothetical protein DFH06DRAFT_1184358 [Mycena polygramma]|nr:hypothetical protein DFH06DRAFT_1184358 [Mycena polygramma]